MLSNGQVWRLYDNRIQGVSSEKLIEEASLWDSGDIAGLLTVLSKTEVENGGLEKFADCVRERPPKPRNKLQPPEATLPPDPSLPDPGVGLLTVQQVANYIGVSRAAVYQAIHDDRLQHTVVVGRIVITSQDAIEYKERTGGKTGHPAGTHNRKPDQ